LLNTFEAYLGRIINSLAKPIDESLLESQLIESPDPELSQSDLRES